MTRATAGPWIVFCVFAGGLLAATPETRSPQPGPAVDPIPAAQLAVEAADGGMVAFADLLGADGRAVCFAFLQPACPLAQEYAPVLAVLAAEFAADRIRFVGVVCECDDPDDVDAYRREFGITFPIHLDTHFQLAEALDATVTPEVVLVDRDRRICYAGRIDDRYKIRGVMTPGDAAPELATAIRELVAGREIRTPRTQAAGCPIDRPERPSPPLHAPDTMKHAATFSRDVLPFLHDHCQKCHSPGQAGPFSLLSYDDAVEWVELGLEEIAARRMPPASLAAVSIPGCLRQCTTFLCRELETAVRDRVGLRMSTLLPLALAAVVLTGFSATSFRSPLMLTRFLDPGEKKVLADVWGEVSQAIATETVGEQDASIPGQMRVFLDSQPKMLAHLREPSTERLVRDALTDTLRVAPDREIVDPGGTFKWLSLMSICMVILGFVTGFREIVKERPMLDLERRHGLWFVAYVVAKVAAMAVVLAVQVAIFRTTVELGFMLREAFGGEVPAAIYRRGPVISATCNWLAAVACATIGLTVSACVRSTDKGVLAVPLLITPQILLGATILPIRGGVLAVLAKLFSPLYWAYRGCRSEGQGVPVFWQNLGDYDPALWIPITALATQIVVAAIVTVLVLRWQERAALGRNRAVR